MYIDYTFYLIESDPLMQIERFPFITFLFMISFGSVNAVLFTPALPAISTYFSISENIAQHTITWFLAGYAIGQLLYGPLASRFGRKPALYIGISIQIVSSFICVLSGIIHEYSLLILGRFLLAIGSGVGLKMTFTLVNEWYEPKKASQKISYLMLAFAVTPGIAVAVGGILNEHLGWMSCFYAGIIYGLLLLSLSLKLPETIKNKNLHALNLSHIIHEYAAQFKNIKLIAGALLMGACGSFVYLFAAATPFIAINMFGMNSTEYGFANMLPPVGLVAGSLISAQLIKKYSLSSIIFSGVIISCISTVLMMVAMLLHLSVWFSLFIPMIFIYLGLCFILANASALALSNTGDKAHGSATLNFINIGLTTLSVLSLGFFQMKLLLLPSIYMALCFVMIGFYRWLVREQKVDERKLQSIPC